MDKQIAVRLLKQNFALRLKTETENSQLTELFICSWHSLGKQDAISAPSEEKRRPGSGLNPFNISLFGSTLQSLPVQSLNPIKGLRAMRKVLHNKRILLTTLERDLAWDFSIHFLFLTLLYFLA